MKIYRADGVPIKLWCSFPELEALNQLENLARLPFTYRHVSLMPDGHTGYGMPIGGVVATTGTVIPNAVGLDIGCGVQVIQTPYKVGAIDLKEIVGKIRETIPVGHKHNDTDQPKKLMPDMIAHSGIAVCEREYSSALRQLGTLGGGNHFIEIQKDKDDNIWVMLHSGSRNLGKKVAEHYIGIANYLNKKWYFSVGVDHDLSFLPIDCPEGQDYVREMKYCIDFAYANRTLMMDKILSIFDCSYIQRYDVAHNYARMENHFGKNVMVHRKGAIFARVGEIGIIPGSQGTKSYIVYGKGNPESFESCSHGAGRAMSRTKAKATLSLEEEIKKMEDKGILHGMRTKKNLEEADEAYKSIDVVMEEQKDLVDIHIELRPLAVIKEN